MTRPVLNGRTSTGASLVDSDLAALQSLGRHVVALLHARGAAPETALALAEAADAAAARGVSLSIIAVELRVEIESLTDAAVVAKVAP